MEGKCYRFRKEKAIPNRKNRRRME